MARRNRASHQATGAEEQNLMAEQVIEFGVDTSFDALSNEMDSASEQSETEKLRALLAEREAEIARLNTRKPRGGGRPARVATLETVVAKQTKTPAKWGVLQVMAQVDERMAVGQDENEAFNEVLDAIREHAEAAFALRPNYNSLMETVWGYFKAAIPKGAISRGVKTPAGSIPTEVDETTDEDVEQVADDSAEYLQSVTG